VESRADLIILWVFALGLDMSDAFGIEIHFVQMIARDTAIFTSPVGQDAGERKAIRLVERQHSGMQEVDGHHGVSAMIEFRERSPTTGVNKCLLIDVSDTLDVRDIKRILRADMAAPSNKAIGMQFQ
jgi:hypothetical protein